MTSSDSEEDYNSRRKKQRVEQDDSGVRNFSLLLILFCASLFLAANWSLLQVPWKCLLLKVHMFVFDVLQRPVVDPTLRIRRDPVTGLTNFQYLSTRYNPNLEFRMGSGRSRVYGGFSSTTNPAHYILAWFLYKCRRPGNCTSAIGIPLPLERPCCSIWSRCFCNFSNF